MNTSFSQSILRAAENNRLPLAADIKPVSPRDGDLLSGKDPVALARSLEKAGVCALSVVTESAHFGGNLDLMRQVVQSVDLPVLRKDFISSASQIERTAEAGAAAVLLTLSTIPEGEAEILYRKALDLGLEPLLEVHTLSQLRYALKLEPGPTVIGINNRNISALEKDDGDVGVTEKLAPLVPDGIAILSESALLNSEDVRRALAAGSHAVLVGTAILKSGDPGACARELAGFAVGR